MRSRRARPRRGRGWWGSAPRIAWPASGSTWRHFQAREPAIELLERMVADAWSARMDKQGIRYQLRDDLASMVEAVCREPASSRLAKLRSMVFFDAMFRVRSELEALAFQRIVLAYPEVGTLAAVTDEWSHFEGPGSNSAGLARRADRWLGAWGAVRARHEHMLTPHFRCTHELDDRERAIAVLHANARGDLSRTTGAMFRMLRILAPYRPTRPALEFDRVLAAAWKRECPPAP